MLSLRSTHLPTDGRPGAKTPGLENAIHRAVDKAASKSNAAVPLQSNTQSRVHKDKDANVGGTKSLAREAARPLGDRTPFPNRDTTIVSNRFNAANTPLPDNQKLAKLLLEANRTNALYHSPLDNTPVSDSVPRASAGRTYVRAPRLSVIQQNTFETPLNNGRHWDVSEAEISVPEVWADSPAGGLELDDYDEVEYMPPKVVDTYTPPFDFDLPNYSAVGKTLLNLSYSRPY
ncbi:hypothetical protein FB451DRAFT_1401796 [Mycena latifolia]|nr:hypothetical protein FB451DRAFT_1401796 [Mycena latifolia]